MILSSSTSKLNLPLVSSNGPAYTKPSKGSDLYNPKQLPEGFKNVKISIPEGYKAVSSVSPTVAGQAKKLLSDRASKNLPYNYAESFVVEENGIIKEYLALVTLHFDNHPKRNLKLPDGRTTKHPPFWHPGVSVFEKQNSAIALNDSKEKNKNDQVSVDSSTEIKQSSKHYLLLKLANIFEKISQK